MPSLRRTARHLVLALCGTALGLIAGTVETENAVANGDTRTLTIYHTHTKESATITFKRDGRYDRGACSHFVPTSMGGCPDWIGPILGNSGGAIRGEGSDMYIGIGTAIIIIVLLILLL